MNRFLLPLLLTLLVLSSCDDNPIDEDILISDHHITFSISPSLNDITFPAEASTKNYTVNATIDYSLYLANPEDANWLTLNVSPSKSSFSLSTLDYFSTPPHTLFPLN